MSEKHRSWPWTRKGLKVYAADGKLVAHLVHASFGDADVMSAGPEMLEALKLAQRWLANSTPTTELDGPKPLPVIAAAIATAEGRAR